MPPQHPLIASCQTRHVNWRCLLRLEQPLRVNKGMATLSPVTSSRREIDWKVTNA